MPSMLIEPDDRGRRRERARRRDDLPLPVRPHMATFSPEEIESVTSRSTGCEPSLSSN